MEILERCVGTNTAAEPDLSASGGAGCRRGDASIKAGLDARTNAVRKKRTPGVVAAITSRPPNLGGDGVRIGDGAMSQQLCG